MHERREEQFERCIVCQEALHLSLDAYGKLICIQRSTLLRTILVDSPHGSSLFVDGCSHYIHHECFRKATLQFSSGTPSPEVVSHVSQHFFACPLPPTEHSPKYTTNQLLAFMDFPQLMHSSTRSCTLLIVRDCPASQHEHHQCPC